MSRPTFQRTTTDPTIDPLSLDSEALKAGATLRESWEINTTKGTERRSWPALLAALRNFPGTYVLTEPEYRFVWAMKERAPSAP